MRKLQRNSKDGRCVANVEVEGSSPLSRSISNPRKRNASGPERRTNSSNTLRHDSAEIEDLTSVAGGTGAGVFSAAWLAGGISTIEFNKPISSRRSVRRMAG